MKQMKMITVLISLTLFVSLLTFTSSLVISNKLNGGVIVPSVGSGSVAPPSGNTLPQPTSDVGEDDDAVMGDKNAPITIIEFSDFECPFCGRFYSQTLTQIKTEYIDTGKVKLVYRDFPLSIHPSAQKAAEAAECVREQGGDEAFFEMHDVIFEKQASLSVSNLKVWAQDLGYDINSCLDSGKFRSEVQNDFSDGQAAGVSGTPTFFINGVKLVGAQPFSAFKQIIDANL